ncbi:MAG: CHAT domain-containing protein, partial [Vicinamibacterales bacterium]
VVSLQDALDEVLAEVGPRIASPLAAAIARARAGGARVDRLVLMTSGLLSYVPLHAAPFGRDGAQVTLLDDLEVTFAPSARVYATACQRSRQVAPASRLAVVADTRPHTHPLPYAAIESVLAVRGLMPDSHVVLQHDRATLDAVQQAVTGATHVHFATHGHFRPEAPLGSHLELAGQEQVTLGDMLAAQWLAGTRLVTFSACDTGLTDVRFLPDEALGLPAAGIRAGAACVIGSLWPVRDLVAALVMGQTYTALADGAASPAAALRRAQFWLRDVTIARLLDELDDVRRAMAESVTTGPALDALLAALRAADPETRPFAHPEYWGAWMATGA